MTSNKVFKIGIIIGSTRVQRVAPQIANFILDAINKGNPDTTSDDAPPPIFERTDINLIDLKDYNLPIFNEPGTPKYFKSSEAYEHETTRVWSRHIASHDAFVFLSAQRNWGIPAELKNAIDYLFHEWAGKPALIVSYGGHGGVQCAEQLKTVVGGGIGMRVVEPMVHLTFPSREVMLKAVKGQDLGLDVDNDEGPWAEHRGQIAELFWGEMIKKMLVEG